MTRRVRAPRSTPLYNDAVAVPDPLTLVDKMRAERSAWASLPWDAPLPPRARGLLPASRVAEVFPSAWPRLDPAARVTLSRLVTLADHEAFILFEEALIGALEAHHDALAPADPTRALLGQFALEERDHVVAFRRYLARRVPDLIAPATAYTFKPALPRRALVAAMRSIAARRPEAIYVFAEFFELLTIRLARLLTREATADPEGVDPLLVALHAAHASEEGRHVAADKRLIGPARLPALTSHLALVVFALVGLVEATSYRRVAARLVSLHPAARAHAAALSADARLTERTRVVSETVSRFAPTFAKLSPGRLAPLYRLLVLREPARAR